MPARWSNHGSLLQIQPFPSATSREHDRNTGVSYDHGKCGTQGVQVCLHDAWHGLGGEDTPDVGRARVDDRDGVDARGQGRKLFQ